MTVSTFMPHIQEIRTTTAPIRDDAAWHTTGIYDRVRQILGYDVRGLEHPNQAWFWTESWQRKEQEASNDVASGRTTVCRSNDELLTLLDNAD